MYAKDVFDNGKYNFEMFKYAVDDFFQKKEEQRKKEEEAEKERKKQDKASYSKQSHILSSGLNMTLFGIVFVVLLVFTFKYISKFLPIGMHYKEKM